MLSPLKLFLGCAFTLLLLGTASGQEPNVDSSENESVELAEVRLHPLQPSDISSPRATMKSFFAACNELFDIGQAEERSGTDSSLSLPAIQRILDCLDLSGLPAELQDSVGVESAVYLKEVLDRIELPELDKIPGGGNVEGDRSASTEEDDADQNGKKQPSPLKRWRIPGTRISIERIASGPQTGRYQFSIDTVRAAGKFYTATKNLPYRTGGLGVTPRFFEMYTELTKRKPTLSADTSSPRGTLTLFLNSANEIFEAIQGEAQYSRMAGKNSPQVMRVISCLDLSELPEFSQEHYAAEAAICLKEILDRTQLPNIGDIPGAENIDSQTGGEKLLRWQIPKTQITIARVAEGPRRGEYLFTPGTVKRLPGLYVKLRDQPYRTDGISVSEGFYQWWMTSPGDPTVAAIVNSLPGWFQYRWLEMAMWQWIGQFLGIGVSLLVMAMVFRIGRTQSEEHIDKHLLRYWLTLLFPIVGMLIPLAYKYFAFHYLTMRGSPLYVSHFVADLVFLFSAMAVIVGIGNRIAETIVAVPQIRPKGLDAHLVRILCRTLGIIAAIVVFLEGGKYLGFPVTTLLASAGIGGVAIALSAQGMMKGLFGTVTILLDKPFRVGERIIVGDEDGYVEEIGLRSTKIRTYLSDHVVSIPNDVIADSNIENIGRRKHIRRLLNLRLPLDTPRANVVKAVEAIRAALKDHDGMEADFPPRVYFNEFNDDSFNIRVICWFSPPKLWEYQEFNEKLNLEIFAAFEENGIQFSLPLRHSHWNRDDEQGPLEIEVVNRE